MCRISQLLAEFPLIWLDCNSYASARHCAPLSQVENKLE